MDHGDHWTPVIDCYETLIDKVLTAVTNVHRRIGSGLFESVSELAAMVELQEM